jgi:hypothetical protein
MSNTNTQTVQLQSVGHVAAKPAKDFKVGEFMAWNFGYASEVLEIVKETKSFITFKLSSTESDYVGERRLGKNRLVAIVKA